MKARLFVALAAASSTMAIANAAGAQAAPASAQADAPSAVAQAGTTAPVTAEQGEQANSSAGDVVVTGSRIVQDGNSMPTPVSVISTEALAAVRPTNLAEALNDLPVFAGSRSQFSNTGTSGAAGSPATSTNALNVLNLRNMGLSRTLILYDGHRVPPSTPEGFVDINTIPQMLLKRVDVVTGGVSAVYGSDAMVGVVNFVTDTGFNGLKANVQYGLSDYGDTRTFEGGIAGGAALLDGRLHVLGSFNHRFDAGLDSRLLRPWDVENRTLQGAGTAASPYFVVVGARQSNITFGGRINSGLLADQQFTSGGLLVPFVHGVKTGQGGTIPAGQPYEIGGDGGTYNGQLRAALELNQGYGRVDFDVTDTIKFHASAAYTDNHSVGTGNEYVQTALTISRFNAFLQPQYATQLANANQATFTFGKVFGFPRSALEADATQLLTDVGFDGRFGNWRWELAYVRGRGDFKVDQRAAINQGHLYAALDSVLVNGTPTCRAALTNPTYSGCVPLNPFGVGSETQAMTNYIVQRIGWTTNLRMDDFSGSISGSPFSTWAGPVSVAVSGEWRRTSQAITSNSLPTNRVDCTGILYGCNPNAAQYNSAVANLPRSAIEVSEGAIEVQAPLARDWTAFKSLDLNLAYRRAHYDTVGSADTWKVGLVWQPVDMLTLRATRSRDFRAPTIDELYRPLALSLTNFFDYISGSPVTTANVPTYNGGNPNLKPEIGNSLTLGAVFRPAANLSLAVDYFNITVKNYIFLVQGNSPPEQQICYGSGGSSPYCGLIVRGLGIYDRNNPAAASAANAVTAWYQQPINIAEQDTNGVDIEANFQTRVFDRPVGLRLLTTYQPHIRFKRAGVVDNDYGGVAFGTNGIQASPKWRITGFLDLKPADGLSINIQERWRSSLKYHSDPTVVVASPKIKPVAYTSVNVAYDLPLGERKMQFFVNVANLFNTDPPLAGFWGNPNPGQFGGFVAGDDVIGRYYTAGIRARF